MRGVVLAVLASAVLLGLAGEPSRVHTVPPTTFRVEAASGTALTIVIACPAPAAECVRMVREHLEMHRALGRFGAEVVRQRLEFFGLTEIELRVDPAGGVAFGARLRDWCIYGEYSAVRTVVEYGGVLPSGSCLRG